MAQLDFAGVTKEGKYRFPSNSRKYLSAYERVQISFSGELF